MNMNDGRRGFANHVDFLVAIMAEGGARHRDQVIDVRLKELTATDTSGDAPLGGMSYMLPAGFTPAGLSAAVSSDEQGGYATEFGGFIAGRTMATFALGAASEGDPTAGRTLQIPMPEPSFEIPARTDKDHSTSVSGGLTVSRKPETLVPDVSRMELELVTLHANTLMGFNYATEELLSTGFAAIIAAGFNDEFASHLLNEKIRGGGGNQFQGVLNSPAKITVAKETNQVADTIMAENAIKMAARCWGLNKAIWLANHDTRLQLYKLGVAFGTSGFAIYQPSSVFGSPDMLLGAPVFYTERCSALGDEGDLILCNWGEYLEGTYQPLQTAESIHVRFVEHERAFKFWIRNDGACWWRAPLTPANGAATLSPIVTLAERA